jgi:hypothetical protein
MRPSPAWPEKLCRVVKGADGMIGVSEGQAIVFVGRMMGTLVEVGAGVRVVVRVAIKMGIGLCVEVGATGAVGRGVNGATQAIRFIVNSKQINAVLVFISRYLDCLLRCN